MAVKLRVEKAYPEDVGKRVVRIDKKSRDAIGVEPGDLVEIRGSKTTVARVLPARREDVGKGIIRMDKYERQNAGASVGEPVEVEATEEKVAERVELMPTEKVVVPVQAGLREEVEEELTKEHEQDILRQIKAYVASRARREPIPATPRDVIPLEVQGKTIAGQVLVKFPESLLVVSVEPEDANVIGPETEIEIKPYSEDLAKAAEIPDVTYDDIGGLDREIELIREYVELPLKRPELLKELGIKPPKGVLLYGPPGTGKTLLAKAVANECGAKFYTINGPEIMSKYVGESEQRIREIFEEARKNAPAIIYIDEIDAIAPKRGETSEVEKRVVAQLLTLMDGLSEDERVVVLASTNRPDDIDPALRRPGRFDKEIEIGVPDKEGRKEILQIHTRDMPLADDVDLDKIAELTHGFTGADLEALCKSAGLKALRRAIRRIGAKLAEEGGEAEEVSAKLSELTDEELREVLEKGIHEADIPEEKKEALKKAFTSVGAEEEEGEVDYREALERVLEAEELPGIEEELKVTMDDFMEALKEIEPSALREVVVEVPDVSWDDVGGLEDVKRELREAVEYPLKYPELYERLGVRPPKGVLLYGPPGTGKTLLAKAVANESDANFIAVKGPEVLSKWVGESERKIREIFKKARQTAPCIIFFDEIDAIAPRRGTEIGGSRVTERVVNQLLTEMDGIETAEDVFVIAATNRPDILDEALLRPGRFDRIVYVPPPDEEAMKEIVEIHTRDMPLDEDLTPEDIVEILRRKEKEHDAKYSGADIEAICMEAGMLAMREALEELKRIEKEAESEEELEDRKEALLEELKVEKRHFEKAAEKVKPSIPREKLEEYEKLKEEYQRLAS